MPVTTSSPVRWSRWMRSVGSSSASFWTAPEIFCSSPRAFGSTASETIGVGNAIFGSSTDVCGAQSVSEIWIFSILATARISPGMPCVTGRVSRPNTPEELRHALAVARARDHGVAVVQERALQNPEVGQLADERVGDRLEDLRDQRRGRVRAQLDFLVLLRVLRDDLALLQRRREVRRDEVHHFLDAQAALPRDVEDRDERALQDGFAERADQFVRRELLVIQEALHQRLVGLDDLVHQRAGGRGHVAQDAFGRLRGRLQHVHDAFESRADADGQVVRHAFRAERFLDPGHEAGVVHDVVAVHLADDDDAGEAAFLRRGVHPAGVEFDAVRGGDVRGARCPRPAVRRARRRRSPCSRACQRG